MLTVEPLVHVHCAVQHVLPGIDDDNGCHELDSRHGVPVQEACSAQLPRSKRRQAGVTSASDDGCQGGLCCRQFGCQRCRVQAGGGQDEGKRTLSETQLLGVPGNIELGGAGGGRIVVVGEPHQGYGLNDLLQHHISKHLPSRDVIALEHLGGRVETVLGEEVEDVDGVEYEGDDPVCDDWQGGLHGGVGGPGDERRERAEGVLGQRRQVVGGDGDVARHGGGGVCRRAMQRVGAAAGKEEVVCYSGGGGGGDDGTAAAAGQKPVMLRAVGCCGARKLGGGRRCERWSDRAGRAIDYVGLERRG